MNLKFTKCALAIASLAAAVSTAQAQSTANPFGASPVKAVTTPALTKAQAKSAMSAAAHARVQAKFLEKLLENESNEFIVIFDDETPATVAAAGHLDKRLADQRVVFRKTRDRVRNAVAGHAVEFREELKNLPHALVRTNGRAALVALLNQPGVQGVYQNEILKPHLTRSMPLVHQFAGPESNHRGAGTTVAVIDTGTDYRVADFGSCSAPGGSCRVSHAVSVADTPYSLAAPAGNHGTNVAAIVAGMAPGTRIAAIDAFDTVIDPVTKESNEGTNAFKVSKGIDWVISNRTALNIVVVNMSLGSVGTKYTGSCGATTAGTSATLYADLIARLRSANVLPVVSSGNEGFIDGMSMPACTPGAVSVGATYNDYWRSATTPGITWGPPAKPTCTDPNDTVVPNRVTCFSNSSSLLTLVAPGALVTAGGVQLGGTSQAAPLVAGAVALLRAPDVAPNETLDQIQARLTSSTATSAALTVIDHRNGLTKPRLDVLSALAHQHYQVMQKVYIAYYGRPADPGGLAFWTVALQQSGAPTTLSALDSAYGSNATVKNVIDSFANSAESAILYGGKPTIDFVTAIYRNSFNREPDVAGRDWWAAQIDSGNLSRGKAAMSIMGAAQSSDIDAVNRKTAVATNFTTAIDTSKENNAFLKSGGTGVTRAREMLRTVGSTTNVAAFQSTVDQTLSRIVAENP